jgi:hypothetical protein
MASSTSSRKKKNDPEAGTAGSSAGLGVSQPRASEADERTRLLPPPATGRLQGYLSPDDPAVSSLLLAGWHSLGPCSLILLEC